MSHVPTVPPDGGRPSWPITMPEGWKVSELQTWRMRLCEHPTGAMVVFLEDRVVVHRSGSAQGQVAASEVEALLRAAGYTLGAGGPDHPTVIYLFGEKNAPESRRS